MRIDFLRLKLNIQENLGYMKESVVRFTEKIDYYNTLWLKIKNNTDDLLEISEEIMNTIDAMNWWHQKMPEWLSGKRKEKKELQERSQEFKNTSKNFEAILDNRGDGVELGMTIKQNIGKNEKNKMNLIY